MTDNNAGAIGVLVMSYGTPENMDSIESYYTHIRRGRPPTAEQLEDLTGRYRAIVGGVFPLRQNTNRQAEGLQRMLDEKAGAGRYVCYQGLKHAPPYIEDGVAAMARDGITEAVGIVLTPQYSEMSVGGYMKRAAAEAEKLGIRLRAIEEYHLHPQLIDALATRVEEGIERLLGAGSETDAVEGQPLVLFSAHSLPAKILETDDPYERQLLATSRAVAEQAGIGRWQFTWQSAGQTGQPWLGPDILETLERLGAEGVRAVLVTPVGFVSDHLEVLYDIDIEARKFAEARCMRLERIRMLNDDPQYMSALAETVIGAAAGEL